jgi:preprotein translocase subunit YajC
VDSLAGILPFVLIALVFWFLIVRPQRRRQQELATTQSALDVGTEVMLGSGIFGTVASLDEETVQLELSPGTTVKVARQAIVKVVDGPDEHQGLGDEHGLHDEYDADGGPGSTPGRETGPTDERHP